MNLFVIGVSSFVVALSGALSPGPLLAVTITRSIKYGARQGPLLIAGHSILEFVMVLLLVAGFGAYLKEPGISKFLSIAGGGILLLMAIFMLRKTTFEFSAQQNINTTRDFSIFHGIVVSISNPYWTVWWVTIGLAYLSIALPRGLPGLIVFFLGHISADFFWYSLVSYSIHRGRAKFSPFVYRIVTICCGIFLSIFGVFLIIKGLI
ncbi:MAG: LysE family transporter [Candidatus Ratteibacteria bacterium]